MVSRNLRLQSSAARVATGGRVVSSRDEPKAEGEEGAAKKESSGDDMWALPTDGLMRWEMQEATGRAPQVCACISAFLSTVLH